MNNHNVKKRAANVELLRILLMLSIVAVHIRPSNHFIGWFVGLVFAWNVDCFMAISGWYGIKLTWRKFLNIWGQIVFYSVLSWVIGALTFPGKWPITSFYVSGGWFGGCYLALMLSAPLLNAGIDALCAQGRRVALLAWGGVALMMTLSWAPLHFMTGVNAMGLDYELSYGSVAFVYVNLRFLRKLDFGRIAVKWIVLLVIGYVLTILAIGSARSLVEIWLHRPVTLESWSWLTEYHAPHVWLMAIAIFAFFLWHVKVPECLSKAILFISPSMFAVYLIHAATPMGNHLRYILVTQMEQLPISPWLAFSLSVIIVFTASLSVDILRRSLLFFIHPKIVGK